MQRSQLHTHMLTCKSGVLLAATGTAQWQPREYPLAIMRSVRWPRDLPGHDVVPTAPVRTVGCPRAQADYERWGDEGLRPLVPTGVLAHRILGAVRSRRTGGNLGDIDLPRPPDKGHFADRVLSSSRMHCTAWSTREPPAFAVHQEAPASPAAPAGRRSPRPPHTASPCDGEHPASSAASRNDPVRS